MKVLHINSYFNGSKFYKNLFDKQVENGLDISVYVPVPKPINLHEEGKENLGRYTTVSANHGKYDRFFFHLKHYKIYKDIVTKFNINEFTILHAHSLFSNGYIALKLKQEYNAPYIVAVRNTDINYFFKKMPHLRRLGIEILKEAEGIIFLSEPYKNLLIKKYVPVNLREEMDNKAYMIPNGIDDFWFRNIGFKEKVHYTNSLKLLHVGVIDKNKNITTTIKAIEHLHNKGYNINFTLVGRIKDQKIYKKIIDLPYINYISPKPQEELKRIYRENDIFVMPSITETFGLVYSEAMSQGLPVIYSKGQGFDRQFEEGIVGYPVDCFNPRDISNKILKVIENYNDITERSLNLIGKFNWSSIASEYEKVYKTSVDQ